MRLARPEAEIVIRCRGEKRIGIWDLCLCVAVMLPLALPWVEDDFERSLRTWPAMAMVERFVEILREMGS